MLIATLNITVLRNTRSRIVWLSSHRWLGDRLPRTDRLLGHLLVGVSEMQNANGTTPLLR